MLERDNFELLQIPYLTEVCCYCLIMITDEILYEQDFPSVEGRPPVNVCIYLHSHGLDLDFMTPILGL